MADSSPTTTSNNLNNRPGAGDEDDDSRVLRNGTIERLASAGGALCFAYFGSKVVESVKREILDERADAAALAGAGAKLDQEVEVAVAQFAHKCCYDNLSSTGAVAHRAKAILSIIPVGGWKDCGTWTGIPKALWGKYGISEQNPVMKNTPDCTKMLEQILAFRAFNAQLIADPQPDSSVSFGQVIDRLNEKFRHHILHPIMERLLSVPGTTSQVLCNRIKTTPNSVWAALAFVCVLSATTATAALYFSKRSKEDEDEHQPAAPPQSNVRRG